MGDKKMIRRGIYGKYRNKEYSISSNYGKLMSRDLKLLENGFNYYIDGNGNYNKEFLEKQITKEDLEDIYDVRYTIVICGKEMEYLGINQKRVEISVFENWSMKSDLYKKSEVYLVANLKDLDCVEHTEMRVFEKYINSVYIKIEDIEKFVEYKEHKQQFSTKGIERIELPNTKEVRDYLFKVFL